MNNYLLIVELVLFYIMIPITFKTLEILDFDKIFRPVHVNRKYLFYIILTFVLSYLFTKSIINIIEITNTLVMK